MSNKWKMIRRGYYKLQLDHNLFDRIKKLWTVKLPFIEVKNVYRYSRGWYWTANLVFPEIRLMTSPTLKQIKKYFKNIRKE